MLVVVKLKLMRAGMPLSGFLGSGPWTNDRPGRTRATSQERLVPECPCVGHSFVPLSPEVGPWISHKGSHSS